MEYKNPVPTVDIIITNEDGNKIVLIKRAKDPGKGLWALPGGHVDYNETVEHAAVREAKEETNLDVLLIDILGVYSDPKRDLSKHKISTCFVAKALSKNLKGDEEATDVRWFEAEELELSSLGFDHGKMIAHFLKWKEQGGSFWSSKQ